MSWFRRRANRFPGVSDGILDGLKHPDPGVRAASILSCGSARLELAVPLLAERLIDPHPRVRVAAASALGRIKGARAADALLRAARTGRLTAGRLAREIARCAPDHYLEASLQQAENRRIRPVLALAACLRGHTTSIVPLLIEMTRGTEAERTAAYHALGSLRVEKAIPLLIDALFDPSVRARQSARGALRRLGVLVPSPARTAAPREPRPSALRRLLPAGRARRTLT